MARTNQRREKLVLNSRYCPLFLKKRAGMSPRMRTYAPSGSFLPAFFLGRIAEPWQGARWEGLLQPRKRKGVFGPDKKYMNHSVCAYNGEFSRFSSKGVQDRHIIKNTASLWSYEGNMPGESSNGPSRQVLQPLVAYSRYTVCVRLPANSHRSANSMPITFAGAPFQNCTFNFE